MNTVQGVVIEDTATPAEVEAVEEAFRRHGLDVEVRTGYGRKALGESGWVVVVLLGVPVALFFKGFMDELGRAAARDAYGPVKAWIRDVWRSRGAAGTGSILLRDDEHTTLALSSSLADEALDALREIDWEQQRGGWLLWDAERREWRNPRNRP